MEVRTRRLNSRHRFSLATAGCNLCSSEDHWDFLIDLIEGDYRLPQMSSTNNPCSRAKLRMAFERFSVALLALATLAVTIPTQASERDDQYLEAFHLIQDADGQLKAGDKARALAKYQKAEALLQDYRRTYPDFGQKMVAFRLSYAAQRISELSEKPAAEAANAPQSAPVASAPVAGVKLLSAGEEPRKVLRLHPKAGDKQSLSMVMKLAMEIQVGQMQNQAIKLPAIKMPMEVTVKSVSPEGDISFESVMGDPSMGEDGGDPQVAAAMKAAIGSVKGMTSKGIMTSRAIAKATEMRLPTGANPQISQALDQMKDSFSQLSAPFPEEAVGTGAKWEYTQLIKSQGMTLTQTATYELLSIDGDSIATKSSFSQTAANQKISSSAMPGMKVDLTKMSGRGTGEFKLDLGQLLPVEARSDSHSEISMGMTAGGQKQSMNMKMDVNLRFETQ